MNIEELMKPLETVAIRGDLQEEVLGITDDSRQVKKGSLFVAVQGEQVDGHAFQSQAWTNGAVGMVIENPIENTPSSRAVIQVNNTRRALGLLASRFHGEPSQTLKMIGVTGTNGKTTVTHLIHSLVEASGGKGGLVGTVGYFIGSGHYQASHTTPGAVALQALLGEMVKARLDTAIVEVSSHALALERVGGCDFDIVVFTNLTQDHLDFHKDMEDYFLAKLRLFTEFVGGEGKRFPKRAIINTDDEKGRRIVETSPIPVWTYSIRTPSDIRAQDIQVSQEGTRFTAQTPMGTLEIRSRLIGEHNVYNLLAAIGVGLEMGTTPQTIESAFQFVNNVPGRFERVDQGQSFTVFVDYAHTEDALIRLLAAAQSIRRNRIITVFGCGGDRDPGKRPKMGQAAVKGSDLVMLTSDNPRTEKPLSIIKDIERGILELPLSERSEYQVIPDRAQAIEKAIKEARTDDIVLIAGKGHEDYQIIGKTRLNFDDREMAKQAILQYQGT